MQDLKERAPYDRVVVHPLVQLVLNRKHGVDHNFT